MRKQAVPYTGTIFQIQCATYSRVLQVFSQAMFYRAAIFPRNQVVDCEEIVKGFGVFPKETPQEKQSFFLRGFASWGPSCPACCYEVTPCQEEFFHRRVTIYFSCMRAYEKSSKIQFSALATLLFVDWIPQANGPPWALSIYKIASFSAICS